jgi:hypothetical protein
MEINKKTEMGSGERGKVKVSPVLIYSPSREKNNVYLHAFITSALD